MYLLFQNPNYFTDVILSDMDYPSVQWLYSPNQTLASSFEVSYSHTIRHTVGLLWTSDQPVAETSTYTGQHNI
jgi:hypothetical protein